MPKPRDIDVAHLDQCALGNERRAWVMMRQATEPAYIERGGVLKWMAATVAAGMGRVASMVVEWCAEYRRRRSRQSAAAMLHAFDDHMLEDIGVARCEIDRLVDTGRRWPSRTSSTARCRR